MPNTLGEIATARFRVQGHIVWGDSMQRGGTVVRMAAVLGVVAVVGFFLPFPFPALALAPWFVAPAVYVALKGSPHDVGWQLYVSVALLIWLNLVAFLDVPSGQWGSGTIAVAITTIVAALFMAGGPWLATSWVVLWRAQRAARSA